MNTWNLFTKRPNRKLENSHAGKYQVKKIISNHVVKLDLSYDFHVHLVFHVNLIQLAAPNDSHLGYVQLANPLIKVDGETEYEVTAIVDFRLFGRTK